MKLEELKLKKISGVSKFLPQNIGCLVKRAFFAKFVFVRFKSILWLIRQSKVLGVAKND